MSGSSGYSRVVSLSNLPTIPGFRLIRPLGRGGMATVYLAEQESLGREIAIKVMEPRLADDPKAVERFLREARTAAALVHRHIVGVHDVGNADGQPYLAMEYLPAGTVAERLPIPRAEALRVVAEVAEALDFAHRAGVVHRDVKPENILRRADGSFALSDFGIARPAAAECMTQDGVVIGTPSYMSPEQLRGEPLDGRADLYSLGVLLFQLLSGRLPYQGTDGWSIGLQHLNAPIPKLPEALADCQPLVDALMAKERNLRPANGDAVAHWARSLHGTPRPALSGSNPSAPTEVLGPAPPQDAPARMPRWRAAMALATVLAIAGSGWWWMNGTTPPTAQQATPANAAIDRSIAVLPFRNLGGDESTIYFSDGLAETSLDMLARVPGLKVIARSSSFTFRDAALDVANAGRTLGVAHLLQGSVQTAGDRVRVTVQLVRAADGTQLWSDRYDRQLTDVFAIQDEIAHEVVRAIRVALPEGGTAALSAGGTRNVAAYESFLRGNGLLWTRQAEDMRRAQAYFEEALALDPGYLQAETMAALAAQLLASNTGTLTREDVPRYRDTFDGILRREPRLAEAYLGRGNARTRLGDAEGALADYDAGLAISPNLAVGHQWRAEVLLFDLDRIDDAVAAYRRAMELDPITPQIRVAYARALVAQDRVAEALALLREVRSTHPANANAAVDTANLEFETGDIAAAFRTLAAAREAGTPALRMDLTACEFLARLGAHRDTTHCLDAVERRDGDPTGYLTTLRLFNAVLAGRIAEAEAAWRRLPEAERPQDSLLLVAFGRDDEALAQIRLSAPGLFATPPRLRRLDVGLYALTAGLLKRSGRTDEADALLRAGLARFADSPRFGEWGTGWSNPVAQGLLGDTDGACREIAALQADGRSAFFDELELTPGLDALHAAACYAPLREAQRARIEAALAPLRAERLWPGTP